MTPPTPLRVAVLGPGGVGGLLAGLLAREGASVDVLASESSGRVIAQRGIRVQSPRFGDFQVPVRASTRLDRPVDVCLVTVKNTQLTDALQRVLPDVLGDALLVPLLNGIDHVDVLRGAYPAAHLTPGTIRVETARIEPGLIRQASPFAALQLAAASGDGDRVERFAADLAATGLDVRVRDDELPMLWEKLSFLAPLALLTTQERANAGAIRTRRRDDATAVIREVASVAAAEGVAIDPDEVLRFLDSVPETMESSMQRDQARGVALEIDAIGGAVVRRGARLGVAVPVTSRLVDELRAREAMRVSLQPR